MTAKNAARQYLERCILEPVSWNESLESQREMATRIAELLETEPRCFDRDCFPAHMTGSAFVVNSDLTKTALMFHRKIGKWMQPGGHADGEASLHLVALKEASEETGIVGLEFLSLSPNAELVPLPFDADIHEIPPWKNLPAHWHFDLRYVLRAPEGAHLQANHESNGLEWVELSLVERYSREESVLRMARKLSRFAAQK